MQSAKMLAAKQVLNSSNAYGNGPIWRRNNQGYDPDLVMGRVPRCDKM